MPNRLLRKRMLLRPWIILAALSLARIAFGYQFQTVATIATDLVGRFDLSYARLGGLIGAYNLLGVFAALPMGLLARRFGDRWVLYAGLALMTAGAAYSAWSPTVFGIGGGRAVAGLGAVALSVLQGKVIADLFAGPRFMIALSIPICAFPIGLGLAQLVLPPVLMGYGLAASMLTDVLPAGLALVLFVASYRTPGRAAVVPRRFSLPSGRECLLVLIGGAIWTLYTAGFSGLTIVTWGNVPGTLAGGGLAARFGGFNIFLIGSLALSIGMTGSALTNWPVAWAVLLGVGGSIQPGVIMAVGTLSARPENRAVGMGLFYTIYYLGGTFAPALCGVAADFAGQPEGGLLAAAAICLLAIPLYVLHRALASHETMLVRA
jgi:MFS family permease